MANGIANAATRSLVNGSDFGDNLMAALPDILGNTIGSAIGDAVAGRQGRESAATGTEAQNTPVPSEGGGQTSGLIPTFGAPA